MRISVLSALALVACGGQVVTRRQGSDPPPPPCPIGTVTVRLVKPDPNPYTNEELAQCSMPEDPELAGTVWCCPPEKP